MHGLDTGHVADAGIGPSEGKRREAVPPDPPPFGTLTFARRLPTAPRRSRPNPPVRSPAPGRATQFGPVPPRPCSGGGNNLIPHVVSCRASGASALRLGGSHSRAGARATWIGRCSARGSRRTNLFTVVSWC